ncbi:microtubule-associated protein 1S [Tamandua tetradactyla]|uniref:microtubule-associated protein 1S n=1 Tax=Tamandua tetradactyla TaxID=48850 RepID=UPI0040548459
MAAAAAAAGPGVAAVAPSSLLLVVGGECGRPGLLAYVLDELERGLRSWDVDPSICSLDEQLKIFVSRHSATFSSIVKGQRSLHHRGDALEALVLLNAADKSLCEELRNLLLDPAPHKLLVLAGPCLEETGELLLQTGGFSSHHFLQILEDKEIRELLASGPQFPTPPTLTITCPTFGGWSRLDPEVPGLQGWLQLRLNPPVQLPASEGLREFLQYVAEALEPPSPFELLEPPAAVGFLKIARPCCYVFPGGLGDAAFFAVNGFTVLVNGGSSPRSSFWKLVRHLDRVDALLVTHAGADSLPGLNSLLRRKVAEREAATGEAAGPVGEAALRSLVSPDLGVVFLNARASAAPATESRLVRGQDELGLALGLLGRLGMAPLPLSRGPPPPQPTVLFQKLGVGRLDLHVLHPAAGGSGEADAAQGSACALLVWHPAGPAEKVVRVLFPGCTPPARLLEGLARLQHLRFLREPVVTPRDLETPPRAGSRESLGSRDSLRRDGRPAPARPGPERPGVPRKEAPTPGPREAKREPRPGALRLQSRDARRVTSAAPDPKEAGSRLAAQPRRAPGIAEDGPRSHPTFRCADSSPAPASGASPLAPPAPPPHLEHGQEGASPEKTQEPLAATSPPQAHSPSPPGPRRGTTESTRRLSLSPLHTGEPVPDASPTVTTPSLPAEVGSPHSTEVDESLSASSEQVLPPGLPLRGPRVRRSASPHDVDLCLVSPCEFEHRKGPPAASPGGSNGSSARSQERTGVPGPEETPPTSVSESLPTLSDSEPLPTVPGPVDSDEDTERFGGPRQRDPLPSPLQDPPPLPASPGICMVDPEILPPEHTRPPESLCRARKPVARSGPSTSGPKAPPVAKSKGPAGGDRAGRPLSARGEPSDKGSRAALSRKPSVPKAATRGAPGTTPGHPVYLDLAYLPGGRSARLVGEEFFARVRALCYVISGQDQDKEEAMRGVLDGLLAGKARWDRELQVTLIPTFESAALREWYRETRAQQQALGVTVLGSNSTVAMQDETFPACKVEF